MKEVFPVVFKRKVVSRVSKTVFLKGSIHIYNTETESVEVPMSNRATCHVGVEMGLDVKKLGWVKVKGNEKRLKGMRNIHKPMPAFPSNDKDVQTVLT